MSAKTPTLGLPGDKSISHRALLVASLVGRRIRLAGPNLGAAIKPLIAGLELLGVRFIAGDGWLDVIGPAVMRTNAVLDMGSSSAAARLLIGLLSGLGVEAVVDGDSVLRERPMDWIVEPLNAMGAQITYLRKPGCLPLAIARSQIRGGLVPMKVASAQAVSAVLLAGFAAGQPVEIRRMAQARDHTERLLQALGVSIRKRGNLLTAIPRESAMDAVARLPDTWEIPLDPSAAAYLAAACFLSPALARTDLRGVCLNPTRLGFLRFLRACGAGVRIGAMKEEVGERVGTISITASESGMPPIVISGKSKIHAMIDEIPLA